MNALLENADVQGDVCSAGEPITFLHSEKVIGSEVIDQPYPDIVAESDTFVEGSSDSDTV